jgi:hypothetical protein
MIVGKKKPRINEKKWEGKGRKEGQK